MAGTLRACNYDFNSSTDSQFTETEEELTFLEACMDCDEDALYDLIQEGVTRDCVNERDKSGRTGLSHACGNGFMPILELLCEVEECDVNLPDKEGNTPLIFAAQAGHADVVNLLLNRFRRVRVDQCSNAGFTALMKASIQGRTRCAKLLLFQGANPNRRDHGRGLCAEEWARFCGRQMCADAISKYVHSKKYFFKKTFMMSRERWSSEPDLLSHARSRQRSQKENSGNWITRHLSFKRKGRGGRGGSGHSATSGFGGGTSGGGTGSGGGGDSSSYGDSEGGMSAPLSTEARSNSSPLLTCTTPSPPASPVPNMRRPSCVDSVVNVTVRKLKSKGGAPFNIPIVEEAPRRPPQILQTDFDEETGEGSTTTSTTTSTSTTTTTREANSPLLPRAGGGDQPSAGPKPMAVAIVVPALTPSKPSRAGSPPLPPPGGRTLEEEEEEEDQEEEEEDDGQV